jgi:hypothetical protein
VGKIIAHRQRLNCINYRRSSKPKKEPRKGREFLAILPANRRMATIRYNANMAKCDEGYLCEVCGEDVAEITESDLYLRFVIGDLDPEVLHTKKERHIRCNPTLGQFIVDDEFASIVVAGPFDKRELDATFVRQRELLVTRGWRRLKELATGVETAIINYPLPEVRTRLEEKTF